MQINITGHRMEVTPSIRAFTEEKLGRLERHFDHITSVNVVFDVEKLRQIAEATVFVSKGELHASSESEDLYTAIDALIDKLDRQLIKHKEKLIEHRNHKAPLEEQEPEE
ncbi:MAG: ribosomal subunit interface protein [Legionella sp.]|nr:MAG: ribosomal subunit interface protein [Legionella sp.]